MKKKLLMSLLLLAITGASLVFAQTVTVGQVRLVKNPGNASWNVAGPNGTLSGELVIPAEHEGLPVTGNNTSPFRNNCTGLTSVIIPASMKGIDTLFSDCPNITSITFLGSAIDVGINLFGGGSRLEINSDIRAKYRAGGAGTYTRQPNGTVWTKQSSIAVTPAPVYSLDGVWESEGRSFVITISGSTGVFTQINSGGWKEVQNKGNVKIGDISDRNIAKTGDLTWSCQSLTYNPRTYVIEGFKDCTLRLSTDGRTLSYYVPGANTPSGTLTRRQ